jgi:hypothetical protein
LTTTQICLLKKLTFFACQACTLQCHRKCSPSWTSEFERMTLSPDHAASFCRRSANKIEPHSISKKTKVVYKVKRAYVDQHIVCVDILLGSVIGALEC